MKTPRRIISAITYALSVIAVCAAMSGCADSKRREAAPAARAGATSHTPPAAVATPDAVTQRDELRHASPADLRECVGRVYRGAVVVEEGRPDNYVTGDFNGDGSEDIAVVVRPAKDKLSGINDELANWIVEDPREVLPPDSGGAPRKPVMRKTAVTVGQNDLLLAIIHGYKTEGWRNPLATQTYLLNNAVGGGMKLTPLAEALGVSEGGGHPAGVTGDVISETLGSERGFLY